MVSVMVSVSDEYKYKGLVKTAFKIVWEAYLPRNLPHAQYKCPASLFLKNAKFQPSSVNVSCYHR